MNKELFKQLVDQGKLAEAKQLVKDELNTEWTAADEGAAYVDSMMQFVDMSTQVNEAYIEELTEIKAQLEALDDIQDVGKKNAELGKIRDQIKDL